MRRVLEAGNPPHAPPVAVPGKQCRSPGVHRNRDPHRRPGPATASEIRPWPALGALCVGFFMILVDMTIVSVATPAILETYAPHGASVNDVIWVTSAYLLAYAVPILITGRLGDRFGPKRMYLGGLVVFTVASLWCGLASSSRQHLDARRRARAAGLRRRALAPQTMAVITRIFPRESRGSAMSLWGATAGVATLVGPILGGVLVDVAGWEWIFFINIPVGIVGFWLAWRLVPTLEVHEHSFDWLGVAAQRRRCSCWSSASRRATPSTGRRPSSR